MKVELINITNNPIKTVFDAYRICYAKGGYHAIKEKTDDEMIAFIKPLMAEMHTSPLEHVSMTFYIEGVSRACLSQITRHRTGKFNVQSQRYVDGSNFDFVMPNLGYIGNENTRKIAEKNIRDFYNNTKAMYDYLKVLGVRKEDARVVLPNATTCNMIVTFDLNNFRKMYAQRNCVHAQAEIRELAKMMMDLTTVYIPFADYKAMYCGRVCNQCNKRVD